MSTGRQSSHTVRVYWEDTDAGGVVYHASYLRFMERGRTELLRHAGIEQATLQAECGLVFVVRRMEIDFRAPGRLDDLLEVETAVVGVGGASLTLSQKVMRGVDVIADAKVVCVALSLSSSRPARLPPTLKARLDV